VQAEGSKRKTKCWRGHFKSAVRVLVTKLQVKLSFIEQRHKRKGRTPFSVEQ
jgi:hypothetical protein